MKILSAFLIPAVSVVLFSCGAKSKSAMLVGKWSLQSTTKDGKLMDADPADKDRRAAFDNKGNYAFITKNDTDEHGVYEFSKDEKYLITHSNGAYPRTDSVMIQELTGTSLKIAPKEGVVISLKKE